MYTDIHAVFLYIKREVWRCGGLLCLAETCRSMDAALHVGMAPATSQRHGQCQTLGGSGSARRDASHLQSLCVLPACSSLVQEKKRKQICLKNLKCSSNRSKAKIRKCLLPPQPVFLAGFGNYGHREANEIWRQPLSLIVTTAAEGGWGALLFGSLAARHAHHFASALHGHAKSHEVAQVHSV